MRHLLLLWFSLSLVACGLSPALPTSIAPDGIVNQVASLSTPAAPVTAPSILMPDPSQPLVNPSYDLIAYPQDEVPLLSDTPYAISGTAGNRRTETETGLIMPSVDSEILALLNEVSPQNLQTYVQTLTGFGTRHALSETLADSYGIGAARRWLVSEFERVGRGRIQILIDEFTLDPARSAGSTATQQNIIAALPGNDNTTGAIVVMAHYDSRTTDPFDGQNPAPGANDNASGVALLLEMARLMSSRTWNRTILFIAFAAEELETQGSHHFLTNWLNQGGQIDFAINNDVVGGHAGIEPIVRVFSPGPDSSPSRQFARYLSYLNAIYFPEFQVILENAADRPHRYGDQREFIAAGVPSLRLTEVDEDETIHHSDRDTFDRLDYTYMTQIARLNLVLLAHLALVSAPTEPPVLTPLAEPGSYQITWAGTPAAASYILAFRRPATMTYEVLYYATSEQAGHITLNSPETAYIFSLAIVDSSGHPGVFSPEINLINP